MNFITFRSAFIEVGCINTHQIQAKFPGFNVNNLTRWTRQGLLVKLRQAFYSFPELYGRPDFAFYLSNHTKKTIKDTLVLFVEKEIRF